MDINGLSKLLNNIKAKSNDMDDTFLDLTKKIKEKDITNVSRDVYYDILPEDEREYQKNNDKYKDYINTFSKSYRQMTPPGSWYKGEELPRKEFFEGTYLQSKEDIIELYKLFMFFGMLEFFYPNYNNCS